MKLPRFLINERYITDVMVKMSYRLLQRNNESSEDFLVRKLADTTPSMTMIHYEDHPEFTVFRNRLEKEGYIKTERDWCNGDIVLKPFYLNNKRFKKDDRFFSAVAMKSYLTTK